MSSSLIDASVEWPGWGEVFETLTLRAGFNATVVLLGTTALGVAAGVVGTFALLRRRALMSDTLSHATLPGIAIAFIVATVMGGTGRSLPVLLLGATATGVLGVLTVQGLTRYTRLREDAAMAIVLSVFFGAGTVLLTYIQRMPSGTQGGLDGFIYGQTAGMTRSDASLMGWTALGAVIAAFAMIKEFRLVCFDPDFARVQGWPVGVIDVLMMSLVVLVTVIGLQAVGLLLVVAMLIIPPAAARFWTERLGVMAILAAVIGGICGYLGSTASTLFERMPPGAVIVLVSGAIFAVSMTIAPRRGVIAAAFRLTRLRLRIAEEHALRAIFETIESAGSHATGTRPSVDASVLIGHKSGAELRARLFAAWLGIRGLARWNSGRVELTTDGEREALRMTRNHRLWEEYLLSHAGADPAHVDREADMVEHVLDAPTVELLEQALARRGRLPERLTAPPSVHPIEHTGRPSLRSGNDPPPPTEGRP